MRLNLNKPFKNLKGEEMSGMTQGQLLAEFLTSISKGNSIKIIGWSLKLYANEEIEIDETDKLVIKELVDKEDNGMQNLYKAQILSSILGY